MNNVQYTNEVDFNSILNQSQINIDRAKERMLNYQPRNILHNTFDAMENQRYVGGATFRDKTEHLRRTTSNYDSSINDILERIETQTLAIEKLQIQVEQLSHDKFANTQRSQKMEEDIKYLTKTLKKTCSKSNEFNTKKYITERLARLELSQKNYITSQNEVILKEFVDRNNEIQNKQNSLTNSMNRMEFELANLKNVPNIIEKTQIANKSKMNTYNRPIKSQLQQSVKSIFRPIKKSDNLDLDIDLLSDNSYTDFADLSSDLSDSDMDFLTNDNLFTLEDLDLLSDDDDEFDDSDISKEHSIISGLDKSIDIEAKS